jgi:hypothetical protein
MNPDGIHTTTAPEGAPLEEVQEGMKEAKAAREAALEDEAFEDHSSVSQPTVQPTDKVET